MATTGTPRVSRYSRVAGTSRMALGPAQTTATGVRPSSSRSDEMSKVGWDPVPPDAGATPARAPWWTPPIPPVAKTEIPAAWAAIIVAETVVAAQPPPVSAAAMLGRAALRTEPAGAVARAVRAASSRPTSMRPALIATVAGTAPAARTAASDALATSMFCGYGRPWLISVDSRATTGPPAATAAETSGVIARRSISVVWFRTAEAYSRRSAERQLRTWRRQLARRCAMTCH